MTVKVNKSKDYTISEIRSGFLTLLSAVLLFFLFGLFTILFNNKPGNDISLWICGNFIFHCAACVWSRNFKIQEETVLSLYAELSFVLTQSPQTAVKNICSSYGSYKLRGRNKME